MSPFKGQTKPGLNYAALHESEQREGKPLITKYAVHKRKTRDEKGYETSSVAIITCQAGPPLR